MYTALFQNVTSKTLILTPNQRLAAALQTAYGQYQAKQGVLVWESLDIIPLHRWFERLWQQFIWQNHAIELPLLLSSAQTALLWQRIIENSAAGQGLLRIQDTAKLAMQAWQLIQAWQLDRHTWEINGLEDVHAFLAWADCFEQETQAQAWLDHARLPAYLLPYIDKLTLPAHIQLVAFDDVSPLYQHFLQNLPH